MTSGSPRPAAARAHRLARAAIGALFFINGFAFATWVSRIPAVQQALGLSAADLGVALAGLGAGSFLSMPASGWLITRFGSRPVSAIATLGCAVALVLPAGARSVFSLGAALGIFGAAMGSMDVAMNAQGVELEHRYDRPIMAAFHALWSLGGMTGASVGGVIAAQGLATVTHFAAVSVLLLAAAAAAIPRLIDTPPPPPGSRGGLRFSRALVALCLLAASALISEGAMGDWTPLYLTSVIGTGPGLAASGYAVFSATMTAGRLTGDWLTLRAGRVRMVRTGALVGAAGLTLALVFQSVAATLLGLACMGAGFSIIVPLVFAAAGRLDARSAGAGLAAVTTAGYLGFLAGPPVIGFLAEETGLRAALTLVVGLALACAALAGFVATGGGAERSAGV
jgi:MFS family permease